MSQKPIYARDWIETPSAPGLPALSEQEAALGRQLLTLADAMHPEAKFVSALKGQLAQAQPRPRLGDRLRAAWRWSLSAAALALFVAALIAIFSLLPQPAQPAQATTDTPSAPIPTPIPSLAPGLVAYVVQAGDTWAGIAASFGVSAEEIMRLNQLTDEHLVVGQVLYIPVGTAMPKAPTPTPIPAPPTIASTPTPVPGWKSYQNTAYGYTIQYPAELSLVKGPAEGQPEADFSALGTISFSGMQKPGDANSGIVFGISADQIDSQGQPLECADNLDCLEKLLAILGRSGDEVIPIQAVILGQTIQGFEYTSENALYAQTNRYFAFPAHDQIWVFGLTFNGYTSEEISNLAETFSQMLATFVLDSMTGQPTPGFVPFSLVPEPPEAITAWQTYRGQLEMGATVTTFQFLYPADWLILPGAQGGFQIQSFPQSDPSAEAPASFARVEVRASACTLPTDCQMPGNPIELAGFQGAVTGSYDAASGMTIQEVVLRDRDTAIWLTMNIVGAPDQIALYQATLGYMLSTLALGEPVTPLSLDGRIAFLSERDGYIVIYAMNADGSGLAKLVDDVGSIMDPVWSPDGQQLLFSGNAVDESGTGQADFVVNVDGGGREKLPTSDVRPWGPHWSATRDAYVTTDGAQLYVTQGAAKSTLDLKTIGWEGQWIAAPALSPDGKQIAFLSYRVGGMADVMIISVNGSELLNLTPGEGDVRDHFCPTWSPDGARIAYSSMRLDAQGRALGSDLFVVNRNGANPVNLSGDGALDGFCPSWSPSGQAIAYTSNRDGNAEIYVTSLDGQQHTRLTTNSARDYSPIWNPNPGLPRLPAAPVVPTPAPIMYTPGDEALAHETLVNFFTLLNTGQYTQAVELYGGDYLVMTDNNPSIDPRDRAGLFRQACEINGIQCLEAKTAIFQEQTLPDTYIFVVEFANPDGSLFEQGPCCGGDGPTVTQFTYVVKKVGEGKFVVQEMPPYVP